MSHGDYKLACLVMLPALLPIVLHLARKKPDLRESCSLAAAFLNLGLVIYFLSQPSRVFELRLAEMLPGVPFLFRLDALGSLLLVTAGLLWPLATLYSTGYLRQQKEQNQTRFFSVFGLAIAATNGVALSGNLLTLYMFYELLSLATYPLVVHQQTLNARSAGRRYLVFLVGGSIGLVLPAMLAIYTKTGSLDFGAGLSVWHQGGWASTLLTLAFLYGFAKAAVMPMHSWLPGAMVAPTPVSSLLHAVAVVKVGVFSVIRAFTQVLGPAFMMDSGAHMLMTALCAVTVFVSAALMMSQNNIKRCLAFSTIGQLSYILLAVSLFNRDGLTGGSLHIVMHAFGKITLFFCAGAIASHAGKKQISELDGLGRAMPWTFGAFTIGALAIVGLPPTGGFLSKWLIVTACLKAGSPVLAGLLLVSSLMKAFAFAPILFRAFYAAKPPGQKHPSGDAPWLMRLPLLLTASGSVLLFFFPGPFLGLARAFTDQVLQRGGLP